MKLVIIMLKDKCDLCIDFNELMKG